MKTNRITMEIRAAHSSVARTQWSVLDPSTQRCRLVSAEDFFPIAGRLLSGVWQLDDGRVLMVTTVHDTNANRSGERPTLRIAADIVDDAAGFDQPTVRVDYVDPRGGVVAAAHQRAGAK